MHLFFGSAPPQDTQIFGGLSPPKSVIRAAYGPDTEKLTLTSAVVLDMNFFVEPTVVSRQRALISISPPVECAYGTTQAARDATVATSTH